MNRTQLIEESIRLGKASLSRAGALVVDTGTHTGRSAKSRYFVRRPECEKSIAWNETNLGLDLEFSKKFFSKLEAELLKTKTYECRAYVGSFPIRVRSSSPWHALFAENMFRQTPSPLDGGKWKDHAKIEVFHAPELSPQKLGLEFDSDTLILLDPVELRVGVVGSAYAGEIKKAAFTLCNFKLPELGLFPMHASANCLEDGSNSCVLFGLSGTGKTTLSASPDRYLIGDDEIIWSKTGLSNLEGGCYAKLIQLSLETEPEIFRAVNSFGAIAENVVMNTETRQIDFDNDSRTENTRGSYSLEALEKVFDQTREADAPKTIVFLMADAFGAMPAVGRLNPDQAAKFFMSGYTAKVAGTEIGIKEPQAVFSACFGAPFMPRAAREYASLLSEYTQKFGSSVWMLNTGWTQGGYGVGTRFPLPVSRRILQAIQTGELDGAASSVHQEFGFEVPRSVKGVDPKYLEIPSGSEVKSLAEKFRKNADKNGFSMNAPKDGSSFSAAAALA